MIQFGGFLVTTLRLALRLVGAVAGVGGMMALRKAKRLRRNVETCGKEAGK